MIIAFAITCCSIPEFKKHYEKADYIHADGMSIVFGTKLFGIESCKERIATTDWFHDMVKNYRCQDIRHFLLGADLSARILFMIVNLRKAEYW